MNELIDEQLREMSRAVAHARAAANRCTWRTSMQQRSTMLAAILRIVEGAGGLRSRHRLGWMIRSGDGALIALVESRTAARTLGQLRAPIVVRVDGARVPDEVIRRLMSAGAGVVVGGTLGSEA